ncbi:MAG: site-specific integrase [Phycisphaerae bacterium]|nr:site-specific integrase [Phycisphaerae bacterium]
MTESLKARRHAAGYVKPMLAAQVMPLIEQFTTALKTKGRDPHYAYITGQRVMRLAAECGWVTLGNVTADSLREWMQSDPTYRGHKISARTINQFADCAYEFGKWLASAAVAKLPNNPLDNIERIPAKHNDEYRRAATEAELNALLSTCSPDRRDEYFFRIYEASLRARAVRHLTYGMIHFDATPPFIRMVAEGEKAREERKHVLRHDIAHLLRLRKKRNKAKASDLVFRSPLTVDDLRKDWARAGVEFDQGKNRGRLDFHAMRKTLVKIAKASGLSLEQASLLLGHKDPRTTRKHYDEDSVNPDLGAFIEKLPTLGQVRRAQ